jgi:hypothetical protein
MPVAFRDAGEVVEGDLVQLAGNGDGGGIDHQAVGLSGHVLPSAR